MPSSSKGSTDVITQISESFATDRYGVDTIERVVKIPNTKFPSSLLADFATHPDFPNMELTKKRGTRSEPGWWTVNYSFEGFLFTLPEPVYELTTSLSQEPIQTHPDFESEIAGTPASPLNGAVFVDPDTDWISEKSNAIFKEFSGGEKAGIDSYLVPGAEWVETKFQSSRPTGIRDVGTIESPEGPNPTVSGRTWLAWAESYVRRGSIYQVRTAWKLSGRNGWDTDIY